jgi:hypothetical protein
MEVVPSKVFRCICGISVNQRLKANAADGQPPSTAFVRGFLLALSPRGGGMTASARQRFTEEVPPLPKPFA